MTLAYKKPFALLEVDELLVGHREVWTSTHGRATRYHVLVDDGVAACRPNPYRSAGPRGTIILNEDTLMPIGDCPGHMACMRNGCRQWFLAAIS